MMNGKVQAGNRSGISEESPLTARERQIHRAILADPEAKQSFEFLLRKICCDANTLVINLVQEAYGPAVVDEESSWETEGRDIRSFAKSLARTARRLEVLNLIPGWKFTSLPYADVTSDRNHIEASFRELPHVLTLYARNMRRQADDTLEFKTQFPRPGLKALQLTFAKSLELWIQHRTGRSYRERLAKIQRVTYKEAGRRSLPSSGETLRRRGYRESRKLGHPKPPKKPGH